MVGEGRAEVRLRAIGVAVLAGLLMVSGTGAALAAQETEAADLPELDVVKARVLERIGDRIERSSRGRRAWPPSSVQRSPPKALPSSRRPRSTSKRPRPYGRW